MRFLALDWGTVRVGVAVSDPDGKIAFPFERSLKSSEAINEIKKICGELEIDKILLGIPKTLSGGSSASTDKAQSFKKKIELEVGIPVDMLDERFSSIHASKLLKQQGIDTKNQKQILDNVAAQVMLQEFLNKK
ncbi:MAG TPA: Holliday junction resolvase RuvX [Verrucomicrobiae bacterium]|nr:Holliday junction resolvase RuvX [Verrucomicrobiae bacterium]